MSDIPSRVFAGCFIGAMCLVLPFVFAGILLCELYRLIKYEERR